MSQEQVKRANEVTAVAEEISRLGGLSREDAVSLYVTTARTAIARKVAISRTEIGELQQQLSEVRGAYIAAIEKAVHAAYVAAFSNITERAVSTTNALIHTTAVEGADVVAHVRRVMTSLGSPLSVDRIPLSIDCTLVLTVVTPGVGDGPSVSAPLQLRLQRELGALDTTGVSRELRARGSELSATCRGLVHAVERAEAVASDTNTMMLEARAAMARASLSEDALALVDKSVSAHIAGLFPQPATAVALVGG